MFVQNQQSKQNKKLFSFKVNALESLIVEFFFSLFNPLNATVAVIETSQLSFLLHMVKIVIVTNLWVCTFIKQTSLKDFM